MTVLLLKLILTPSLIGAASLAGRRWGHAISGWLVALPLTTGPIIFLLAISHGADFAADAAVGILTGCFSLAAFVLLYARLAPHAAWLPSLAAGTAAFVLLTIALRSVSFPAIPTWIAVLAAFALVLRMLPRYSSSEALAPSLPSRWDIPLRMAIATAFVLFITGIAPVLGPHLTGLLTPFPLFTATMTCFAHHQSGAPAAVTVLRGLMMGIFAYATFMFTLAVLLRPLGIPGAFTVGVLVEIAFQAMALWLLRARTA